MVFIKLLKSRQKQHHFGWTGTINKLEKFLSFNR